MKRVWSLLLVFLMLFGMMPMAVLASDSEETTENQWNGRSAVFVGDSITAGVGTTEIYYQLLNETLGFGSVTAMGVAGSCISAASDYGQNNQPLINRYQNIPSADLIVIFMGTNDYGHETPLGSVEDTQDGTFYGALNAIIPALTAKHPSSKIVFVTPLHRYGFGTSTILGTQFTSDREPNGVGATLGDYADALKTVCAQNGVSVIDLYTECVLDPADSAVRASYMPDGLHPNAAGHAVIAGIMESHIQSYSPVEKAPETEAEPDEETELVYGNKFASGFTQQNRASSRVNLYLKAGTVITLKNPDVFQWACTKTSGENSCDNLGYFPDSAWSDKETAAVAADGWVGFVFKYRDELQTFDLTKPLSDYITIEEPHSHTYENGICTGCGAEHPGTSIFAGNTISILGDSISTYTNYSNGTAADNSNCTIANGAIYYPRSGFDVTAESTWWYQAAETLGMEILVNNSWSGSCLLNERSGTVGAYVDRCVRLHDDTGDNAGQKPDIIAIFLGTNDYYTYPGTLGSYEEIDFDTLISPTEDGYIYAQPVTSMEAYAICLHKIARAYPDAQVYCFTLLPRVNSASQPTAFSEDICQLAEYFGVNTVDLCNCGIRSDSNAFYKMMGDSLHPDNPGMDAITNAFVSALLKHNGVDTCDVVFDLEGVVALEGTTRTVVAGDTFETNLAALDASLPLEITVTMDGADITESCVNGNKITIPAVTGEVVITAEPGQREPLNFRWETQGNALVSVTENGNAENALTMTHGTITEGVYAKTRFTMSQGISLRHDLPWCVEWKSSGTWTDTTDGALLFSEANTSATADSCYFYRRHKNDFFAFGTCTGGKYHNYGVAFAGTGIDTTAEHVFRLENRIADDGSNMVWLLVDGTEVGPMNHHWIGGTDQKETVDWVSGRDFTFSYMGTSPHTIGGCNLEYIQVWEAGEPDKTRELYSYRWEMDNNALVPVTANGNTANELTLDSGSVTDGTFSTVRYGLQTQVRLYHDAPWAMEWRSTGNWSGMLFSSTSQSPSDGLIYLFRDPGSRMFAFGEYDGAWNNYGMILDCDMSVPHVFRLENRIAADGSNAVYLLVDGEEIGAMHHYYISGKYQNQTVNWADGKDIVFSNIGTTSHPMKDMQLEYLQVWENGHDHIYTATVTAPTCTEQGYTTYTCSCGGSYTAEYVGAAGHSYENGICTVCGTEAPGPYAGKTIACIGDSITYGVGVTQGETDYVTLLAKSMEMEYIRLGVSGSTLCTDGHATCNIGKLTEDNLAGADIVTILIGINDFVQARNGYYTLGTIDSTDTSTIYGAAHMWCREIVELRQKDSLKDTEFYFMTPVITSWNNSVSSVRDWDQAKTNIHGYTLRDLCNAIIEVCALYDIPVIDLNLVSGLYYNSAEDNNIDKFGGDGAHPGPVGHQMMAAAIENVLLQNHLRDDHDHVYGSWVTTTYPACESGEQQRVCAICTATESRKLAGKGHTYENGSCAICGAKDPLASYEGKVISIMGDSISTFAGYIPEADGFNREHLARYPQDNLLTDVNETWWMQVVAALDAKLGINDSWRGATLSGATPVSSGDTGENAAMSNLIRIQNLGSNGTPDVILLYGGTNDLAHVSKVGTFDPATAPTEVDLTTKKWDNLADGFVHTLLRMRYYYPDARIVALLPTYTASYYSDEKLAQGNAVMAAICEHYGIPYVDLRESGVTAAHLPDGIHPGEEGMDLITDAVLMLLRQQPMEPGENVVWSVTHALSHAQASLGHYKGISQGEAFVETLTGEELIVTVTMGGRDVTAQYYADGMISIPNVTGPLEITAKGRYDLLDHLQQLPDPYWGINLWEALEHDPEYYSATGWQTHSSGAVKSITFPVTSGDRLSASSFGAAGTNGGSMNGIRVTFFDEDGVLVSMTADAVYAEFSAKGCLTVPEGAVAVSIPMWTDSGDWDVHFLSIWEGRLQQLPENICSASNLWTQLDHDPEYYTAGGWGVHSSGKVRSITIPVAPGDQIWATSFQNAGANGGSMNGIRLTWFDGYGVLISMSADAVYREFSENGFLTAPEGAVAVNIALWNDSDSNEVYILNREHSYADRHCTACGILHTSTFQILDTRCNRMETFTYEVGMTWREWLNSGYNTGMGSCIAIWVSAGPDILDCNPEMDIFVNGDPVNYDVLICEQDVIELVRY